MLYGIYCLPFGFPRFMLAIGAVPDPQEYSYRAINAADWIGIAVGARLVV